MGKGHHAALLCGAALLVSVQGAELAPPADRRFEQVIASIRDGEASARIRFAAVALAALIRANRAEVARTGRERNATPAQQRALARWRAGTETYVAHLEWIARELAGASDIQLVVEAGGVVRLIVGREQVMLTAPRLTGQDALEAEIAATMCATIECRRVDPTLAEAVADRNREVRREWVFGDRAPPLYSNSDGLHCVFQDRRHLKLKETACEAVLAELRLLAEGLRAISEHGRTVDWAVLAIRQAAPAAPERVTYDRSGHYFQLDLPYLGAADQIWRGAIPWMQARLRGQVIAYMISAPERLAYIGPPPRPLD